MNAEASINQTKTQLREVLLRGFRVFANFQQVALYVRQLSVHVVNIRPLAHLRLSIFATLYLFQESNHLVRGHVELGVWSELGVVSSLGIFSLGEKFKASGRIHLKDPLAVFYDVVFAAKTS